MINYSSYILKPLTVTPLPAGGQHISPRGWSTRGALGAGDPRGPTGRRAPRGVGGLGPPQAPLQGRDPGPLRDERTLPAVAPEKRAPLDVALLRGEEPVVPAAAALRLPRFSRSFLG